MIYYFMFGKDYKEIMGHYIGLTGKPIMPPKWALGFAQCRGMLTREDLTREIATGYRKRGIPCDIIYQILVGLRTCKILNGVKVIMRILNRCWQI